MFFTADFETTTKENDCRVWAWAVSEIGNNDNIFIGNTIDSFMNWCEDRVDNDTLYFHNLKFDAAFIISWLFNNGFEHITDSKDRKSNTFKTMINDKGMIYSLEVVFYLKGKHVNKVTFIDSLKIIPLSVEDVAESFHLPIKKGKIDYDRHNNLPYGSPITNEEQEYIINDVKIMSYAMNYFFQNGLDKITIGSCALAEYKNLIGISKFNRLFPQVKNIYDDLRQGYRGGFSYVEPELAEKKLGKGIVLDKNSMYPWVMKTKMLPYGTSVFFEGKYEHDSLYPLYTQMIKCQFELKKDKIPTIQIKGSSFYRGNEYVTSSNYEEVILVLNSPDLELFLQHYDVYNIEYISGWKFKGITGLFDSYIDKWMLNKTTAKEEENWGLYTISKLFLNALYGKFGTSVRMKSKIPYMDAEGVVRYKDTELFEKEGVYLPMASFITSYAREEVISSAQKIKDDYNSGKSKIRFVYADTDSLHCVSDDFSLPEGLYIDKYELGAWKFESKFKRAKFLRQKCYIEDSTEDVENEKPEYKMKITVAGMPDEIHKQVNFNNFKFGATYKGKKMPTMVKGGVVLESIDFTIKKL